MNIAGYADLYQLPAFYQNKYSDGKYDRLVRLKQQRRKLEMMVRDYYRRYKAYAEYMKTRGGDWNDYEGRNDMGGLGLSPGDDSEQAGWYYLGDTDTVEECKRAALKDDALYTRVVHYTPDNGYKGPWQYGCYGSTLGARTSSNSRFNSIGVTTSDRTYWVDEPVIDADRSTILPPSSLTSPASYNGWIYLGSYPAFANDPNGNGLYGCKELAKKPAGPVNIKVGSSEMVQMSPAATYASNEAFNTILYLDNNYSVQSMRGTCYARSGPVLTSNSVFLYKTHTIKTAFDDTTPSGTLIYNNADQSRSTYIFVSVTDLQVKNLTRGLAAESKITIQDPNNPSNYQKWTITRNGAVNYGEKFVTIPVTSDRDSTYKFWSVSDKSNVIFIAGNQVSGATTSHQTRCMDGMGGDIGETEESENSGPPILKSQMVKDLRARYDAILKLKGSIDTDFEVVPELSNEINEQLESDIFEMQTVWEPEAYYYRNKVQQLESGNTMLDSADSHILLNSNRYIFVFYTIYALIFVCGLIYLYKADEDAPAVKYVQIGLGGSFALWLIYHIVEYVKQ
jgi:hypothetical protein